MIPVVARRSLLSAHPSWLPPCLPNGSRRHSAQEAAARAPAPDAAPTTPRPEGHRSASRPAPKGSRPRSKQPDHRSSSIFDLTELFAPLDRRQSPIGVLPSSAREPPSTQQTLAPRRSFPSKAEEATIRRREAKKGSPKMRSKARQTTNDQPRKKDVRPQPGTSGRATPAVRDPWTDDSELKQLGKVHLMNTWLSFMSYVVPSRDELHLRVDVSTLRRDGVLDETVKYVTGRWIHDSDVSPRSVDPITRQKIHSSGSALDKVKTLRLRSDGRPPIRGVLPDVDGRVDEPCLEFFWQPPPGEVRYSSLVPLSALGSLQKQEAQMLPEPMPWVASDLFARPSLSTANAQLPRLRPELSLKYADFNTADGLYRTLYALRTTGLVFLRGVPTEATSNAECELRKVATRIGGLRHTFYGETWDVKALGTQGKNIAYTSVDLGLHMDLLYFENPPQIQMLHCLRNRVVSGGDSYFVDSFEAAERLRQADWQTARLLSSVHVPYHYKNDAHHYRHSHPVIERDLSAVAKQGCLKPIKHVNWSPPFQAALPPALVSPIFDALAAFERVLRSPDLEYRMRLQEGDLVLFDNRRVLHARTAFIEPEREAGEGPSRWLKGGYVDGDAAWDKLRVLGAERGFAPPSTRFAVT